VLAFDASLYDDPWNHESVSCQLGWSVTATGLAEFGQPTVGVEGMNRAGRVSDAL